MRFTIVAFTVIAVMVLGVFSASTVSAQNFIPGKWWNNARVTKTITITDAEKETLEALFTGLRENQKNIRTGFQGKQKKLNDLINAKTLDESAIMKKYGENLYILYYSPILILS